MRIVHVVEPFASGIATFVRLLVEGLQEDTHIVVHGERKEVMRSDEVKLDFPSENVEFIRWHYAQRELKLLKDLRAFVELYRILKRLKAAGRIDAVHLHSSKSGFLGRLACRFAKIDRVVYTPNGAPFLSCSRWSWFFALLERAAALFGGIVVCCSRSERKAYRALGIKALLINNGVDLREETHTPDQQHGKFRIVTCGRIIGQKNPGLFDTIARYFVDFEDFEFVWIGDGPDRGLLRSPNIVVTGWLSTSETQAFLSTGQVYLSTSIFEGLPFSALEALTLKKPMLLKDCIGNRDLVSNGINGDLYRSADEAILQILRYYSNPDMLPLMGEYSKRYCEQEFNAGSTFIRYRNLYSIDHA